MTIGNSEKDEAGFIYQTPSEADDSCYKCDYAKRAANLNAAWCSLHGWFLFTRSICDDFSRRRK